MTTFQTFNCNISAT